MINTIWYSFKQGVKNLYKNRMFTLASIGTIVACLFMFGMLLSVGLNFQYMMRKAEEKVGITVFFEKGIEQSRIDEIGEEIKAIELDGESVIKTIEFISAEQAWQTFSKEIFGDEQEILEGFGKDNPLEDSASYEVYLKDIAKQSETVKRIEAMEGVRQVQNSEGTAIGLTNLNKLAGYASAAIIVILLGVAVFLISNTITIGITVRKEEIGIMKLIGATDFFVKAPFIIEGILIGFIGSMIPIGILYLVYDKVIEFIVSRYAFLANLLTFLPTENVIAIMAPASLIIGIGIGFIGSQITIHRHLRV